jgi:hypothetical protein
MTKFFESSKITDAWSRARARVVTDDDPRIDTYVAALAAEYSNGTVSYAAFELDLAEDVFAMATHHENWKYSQLLELLWLVPAVAAHFPRVRSTVKSVDDHFASTDVFFLAAVLCQRIRAGGAYSQAASIARAFELGVPCAQALAGEPCAVLLSEHAWCNFFFDVAWDFSVVVVSPVARRVKVLLATDTD